MVADGILELWNRCQQAEAKLEQLRADVRHAAEWAKEPGVTIEFWPWLLARLDA